MDVWGQIGQALEKKLFWDILTLRPQCTEIPKLGGEVLMRITIRLGR